jgi:hypothetical protein
VAVDSCEQVVLGLRRTNRRPENKKAGSHHGDEPSHQTPSSSEPPCRVKWGERTNDVGRTRVAKRSSCLSHPLEDHVESSSYVRVPAAHACPGVAARPCTPIEIAQMDVSRQHIRFMEIAEILR